MAAAKIQEAFPDTRVVKSLNAVNVSMTRRQTLPAATTVFLSGNDSEAKKVVSQLLTDLGWALVTRIEPLLYRATCRHRTISVKKNRTS